MLKFPYYLLAEWICFIMSILLIRNPPQRFWNLIKYYLLIVVVTESTCYYMAWVHHSNNQWVYNLFMPVEFTFDIWMLSKMIYIKLSKYLISAYITFYTCYLIEWWHIGVTSFFDKTCVYGSVLTMFFCLLYFYSLFKNDDYLNLLAEPAFWFVAGCFIFYTTSIGVDTFFNQLVRVKIKHTISLRYLIMNVLNLVLYGFWIKAFLCLRVRKTSISL